MKSIQTVVNTFLFELGFDCRLEPRSMSVLKNAFSLHLNHLIREIMFVPSEIISEIVSVPSEIISPNCVGCLMIPAIHHLDAGRILPS